MPPSSRYEDIAARRLASAYLDAKAEVIQRGYASEIDWQYDTCINHVNERLFMRESAWVILSSGLSERVVRSRFPLVCEAFDGFLSAADIWRHRHKHRICALSAFRFAPKIDAIIVIAGYLARTGVDHVCKQLHNEPIEFLLKFPYLGPATSRHLAKNLGVPVAKPDRHMVRIAARLGFPTVSDMCGMVSSVVGDPVSVIDLVIWRYATLGSKYAANFCGCAESENSSADIS
jgi:hypothetical protein